MRAYASVIGKDTLDHYIRKLLSQHLYLFVDQTCLKWKYCVLGGDSFRY